MVRSREEAAKKAEASRTNRVGTCQLWTRTMFDAPSAGDRDTDGDADAVDGWKSEPFSKRHKDRNPPRGVPVAWSGGRKGYGHRAISLGNGKIRSTDAAGPGRVATVDLDWPERHWGMKYLGWSETITGQPIPHKGTNNPKPPKPPKPPKKKPMATIVKEVIANKWGKGPDRRKRLTDAGYNYRDVQAAVNKYLAEKTKAKPAPNPKPAPKPENSSTEDGRSLEFRLHLVPGNKKQSMRSVMADMKKVNAKSGPSAVVVNTERESIMLRTAVRRGLGAGWKTEFGNENTMAYASDWTLAGDLEVLPLAKEDPSMARVSPRRYLNTLPLENVHLKGITVAFKGTHLLSEANCIHTRVLGRKWREKMWPIQLRDVLDDIELDHKAGFPVILAGDLNTGVHFNGRKVFEKLRERFGDKAVYVHDGGLDHIFMVSTNEVKLSRVGKSFETINASDHEMITATIRMEIIH